MPTLNPAFVLQEYIFTEQEAKLAKILTPIQIQWLHTQRAHLYITRNSVRAPEDQTLDRSFLLKVAELDGQISFIEGMLRDHEDASKEIAAASTDVTISEAAGVTVAQRASNLVDGQS